MLNQFKVGDKALAPLSTGKMVEAVITKTPVQYPDCYWVQLDDHPSPLPRAPEELQAIPRESQ